MFTIVKQLDFAYGHRLLNYDGKCRHLHGHNGKVEIVLAGEELDERGMVVDFGDVKRAMKAWIDEHFDHRMLLNKEDPLIPLLQEQGEPLYLMDGNPTAEGIARQLHSVAREFDFPVQEIRFWESPTSLAVYRPQ